MFHYIGLITLLLCVEIEGHNPFRIVGGYSADIEDVSYIASLLLFDVHSTVPTKFCGGTIISKYTIISAAHCYYEPKISLTSIRVGSAQLLSGGWTQTATKHIIHEHYDNKLVRNDIALVILDQSNPIPFGTDGINIIAMEFDDQVIENAIIQGRLCAISGWGTMSDAPNNGPSLKLQTANVPLVSRDSCKIRYKELLFKHQICAGGNTKDTCTGDSGGPLVLDDRLIGITSWGYGCGKEGLPGIYTRISSYQQWIKRNME